MLYLFQDFNWNMRLWGVDFERNTDEKNKLRKLFKICLLEQKKNQNFDEWNKLIFVYGFYPNDI